MDQQQLDTCLQGLKDKDERSQALFYRYCYNELMKVCLRYHSCYDDAASSFNLAMLTVLQRIGDYRKEGHILAWVRRIIVNTSISQLRKNAKFQHKEIVEEHEEEIGVVPEVYGNIDVNRILQLVQSLPTATRLVFNMYVLEGFTHEQISFELNIAKGTSKWHLNYARTVLKNELIKQQAHETGFFQK